MSCGNEHSGRSFIARQASEVDLESLYRVSVVLDRAFSTLLGRACVLQDEE